LPVVVDAGQALRKRSNVREGTAQRYATKHKSFQPHTRWREPLIRCKWRSWMQSAHRSRTCPPCGPADTQGLPK